MELRRTHLAALVNVESSSLSLEPLPRSLLPYVSSSIFIHPSYPTMFDTVWAEAMSTKGMNGVIITGQPGTGAYSLSRVHYRIRSIVFEGKTLFNYYLLVRLLQRKQVALFSPDGKIVYLFYFNEVYAVSMDGLSACGCGRILPSSDILRQFYLVPV
jgi:hypothetical protein